jgi:hypothetical protein
MSHYLYLYPFFCPKPSVQNASEVFLEKYCLYQLKIKHYILPVNNGLTSALILLKLESRKVGRSPSHLDLSIYLGMRRFLKDLGEGKG